MATLDLSQALQSVDMTDPNLVSFGTVEEGVPTAWSYFTPAGHDVELRGQGMLFDVVGHALTGTVDDIFIDVGNNDFDLPELRITGFSAAAATLDDGPQSFWHILDGDDIIIGPSLATAGPDALFTLFGDGITAPAGSGKGGADVFNSGDAKVTVFGDVIDVGSDSSGGPAVVYRGGGDQINGAVTAVSQFFYGDASHVFATGKLIGGNDTIVLQASGYSSVVGDAGSARGIAGDRAEVVGGNDVIFAGADADDTLIGDVATQLFYSFVRGGSDTIDGGEQGDFIVGDVGNAGGLGNATVGGADTIWGHGGDDVITGDVYNLLGSGKLTGGNDIIHGGEGRDIILGEFGNFESATVTGGNDELFGEEGDDTIYGQTGNDLLDGGTGGDELAGGKGNDTYVIDDAFDVAVENAGEGVDTVQTTLAEYELEANFEKLTFIGLGDFDGIGNDLGNTITAGGAADFLYGLGGNDRLVGGAGDDAFFGGIGQDVLQGGAGVDILYGEAGNDRLDGGADDDHLFGGTGADVLTGGAGNDTFLFFEGDGRDRVADFENGKDVIDLSDFDFASFAAVKALATDVAGDLRIDFGNGDVLVIDDFTRADFTAGDVLL